MRKLDYLRLKNNVMKFRILFVLLLASTGVKAQLVGGDLVQSGRQLAADFNFIVEESMEGALFYRLAVDHSGKVTSVQLLTEKSAKISTPMQVRMRTYVLGLKFEPGTFYPKFHDCEVKINLVKKKSE